MARSPGTRLGTYEVVALLGSGGMGEVYKATDTRLGRAVAIKVLPAHISGNPEARLRFEREARTLAALSHPHICPVFDVGAAEGTDFLVMEYLEGETLAERLTKGELPLDQVLRYAIQMADALHEAHRHGVVHRDLKPGNIMLTRSGAARPGAPQVKLLDFGLAKTPPASDLSVNGAETRTTPLTGQGTILGTLNYMAREQVEGRDADARSDLFAFGAVLYEMVTGTRAFDGDSAASVMAAILTRDPPLLSTLKPLTPRALDRIVATCLAKEPDERWQSAGDLARELRWIAGSGPQDPESERFALANVAAANVPRRRVLYTVAGLIMAVLFVAGGVGLFYTRSKDSPAASPSEYTQLTDFTDSAVAPSLSPDGRMVTFIRGGAPFLSRGQIYVKLLPNGESVRLTNDTDSKFGPVFTPDGSRVAYTRAVFGAQPSWDTWTVPILGGEPTRLLPNASGLTWLNDRRLLFSEIKGSALHMGIVTATESRAEHREVYFPAHERAMAHYSYASPDSQSIVVVEMDRRGAFSQPCRLLPFDGSSVGREVGPQGRCTSAGWSPDGRWMYFSAYVGGASHVWRQRFPEGRPEQITFGPTEEEGVAVAPDGRSLVTSLGLRQSTIWIHDTGGDRVVSSEGFAFAPTLSRDRNRVFYLLRQGSTPPSIELRSVDLDSGKRDNLLPGFSVGDYEISHDEKEVVFATLHQREPQIWVASLDRRSSPRQIVKGGDQVSFGADGALIFRMLGEKANLLFKIKRDGSGLEQIFNMPITGKGQVSPDGEWVIVAPTRTNEDVPPESIAVPVGGGTSKKICSGPCEGFWTSDGKLFHVVSTGPVQRTVAIALPQGSMLPDLPGSGIGIASTWPQLRGAKVVERALFPGTGDFSTYVFVKQDLRRNLFRIPLR